MYAPSVLKLLITLLSCSISTYHSRYPCYSSPAVLCKHSPVPPRFFAISFTVYRFSSRYLVTLSLSLSASFNRAYTFGPSSCCPTNHVTLSLSLQSLRRFHQEPTLLSFQSLKLSSCSYPVAVHLRRRPLHPRHESQHPSLAGARPLERAYCHEHVRIAPATSFYIP